MKPDSIYYFIRILGHPSRYILINQKGKNIPNFPSVYKNGKNKGKKYIVFRETSKYYNQKNLQFSHAIELAKSQLITKFYFMPEYPSQSYGEYKEYGLLIEFSKDFTQLAIWFFKGLQKSAPSLFQRRQAGQIPEITKNEVVRLKYRTDL